MLLKELQLSFVILAHDTACASVKVRVLCIQITRKNCNSCKEHKTLQKSGLHEALSKRLFE